MKAYLKDLDKRPVEGGASPLHILWTTESPVTSEHMLFMYGVNALRFGWWEKVHLIVWGGAIKLLSENTRMQELLAAFVEAGGHVSACRLCIEQLGLMEKIQAIPDIEILYIGGRFTRILQSGDRLISI